MNSASVAIDSAEGYDAALAAVRDAGATILALLRAAEGALPFRESRVFLIAPSRQAEAIASELVGASTAHMPSKGGHTVAVVPRARAAEVLKRHGAGSRTCGEIAARTTGRSTIVAVIASGALFMFETSFSNYPAPALPSSGRKN